VPALATRVGSYVALNNGLRLFTLPGQRQARKASVMFVPGDTPRLELAWMGSNRRLSYLLWQRPAIPGVL